MRWFNGSVYQFTFVPFLLAIALMASLPVHADSALNATVGTTGLGLEWSRALHPKLRVRGVLSYVTFDQDETEDGIDYSIELDSANAGALIDWHPFSGGFRVSTGLIATSFGLDLESTSSQSEFDVGDTTYTSDNLKLNGEAEFNPVAPYFGFGWASSLSDSGMYFSGELGVLYIGDPKLTFTASGQVSEGGGPVFDVSTSPQFQSDLEAERQQLEDDIEGFSLWPVLNIGIGYRF